jgi:hypothetical protein
MKTLNTDFRPDFARNIRGCLEKYGDVEGTLKWFARAEEELSSEGFVDLVDATIQDKYEDEPRFSKIFILRNHKKIAAHSREDVKVLFEEGRSEDADELFHKIKQIFNVGKCKELRDEYRTESFANDLKDNWTTLYTMDDAEALSLAYQLIKHNPRLCEDFSWDGLKAFVIDNRNCLEFPQSIYSLMLGDIAGTIKRGKQEFDEDILSLVLDRVLSHKHSHTSDSENVWTVLCAYPGMLKRYSSSHKKALDAFSDGYPFDYLMKLGSIYLPCERFCIEHLKSEALKFDKDQLVALQMLFKIYRYFNCEVIVALLLAKKEKKRMRVNDILLDLVREIVNRAFNYNLVTKNPIENLIFPRCISNFQEKHFQITERKYVFCEGHLIDNEGDPYILCRNRRCDEMTARLHENGRVISDSYFINFLKEEFDISSDQIFSSENFVRGMGSFNRWNEIGYRLVCGYGEEEGGCGKPLMYSSPPQVKAGWAAYAVTFWRCSNTFCKKQSETIKLSHCGGGCGRIIDSRVDRISCKREDGKLFYICLGCGYCCEDHKVSGICPKCGLHAGWKSHGEYGKKYSCLECGHEIVIPGSYKHCLDSNIEDISPENVSYCSSTKKEIPVSDYDDIPF